MPINCTLGESIKYSVYAIYFSFWILNANCSSPISWWCKEDSINFKCLVKNFLYFFVQSLSTVFKKEFKILKEYFWRSLSLNCAEVLLTYELSAKSKVIMEKLEMFQRIRCFQVVGSAFESPYWFWSFWLKMLFLSSRMNKLFVFARASKV